MNDRNLKRLEQVVAVVLSLTVLFLLVVRMTHAGPLWRDECGAVALARLPHLIDIARNFQHEAFPLLFPVTVRTYTILFGTSDLALRVFGFLIGLLFLLVAWFNARLCARSQPSLLLLLVGLNTSFLTWGITVRGYGLGLVLYLLALGLTVRSFQKPTRANLIWALLASIASVQCLVANVPLIGAMVISAITVLVVRARYKQALVVCGLAAICAASFLPYLHSYLHSDWNIVLKYPATFWSLCRKLLGTLGTPSFLVLAMWVVALIGVPASAVRWFREAPRDSQSSEKDSVRFFLILVASTVIAYAAFLKLLSYETQAWYYIALIGAVAGTLDLMSSIIVRTLPLRVARLLFVVVALVVVPFAIWTHVTERLSNIDIVAQRIEKEATDSDLVVVNPWHLALSFQRYYRGNVKWITVPQIGQFQIHRYDLLKKKMQEVDPLADVRVAVQETLQSGGRVWIVGGARPPQRDLPRSAPPAPSAEFGWSVTSYTNIWSIQLGAFLQDHVVKGDEIISASSGVNEFENVTLLTAKGWVE